jgi:hypothetical protein
MKKKAEKKGAKKNCKKAVKKQAVQVDIMTAEMEPEEAAEP